MATPVVTVVAGGLPVVETPFGTPITEATNGFGAPVTKVVGKPGLPVVFETIGVAIVSVTWDIATVAQATLSGGNLIVTNTATTSTNQGARVANASGKTSGKYYFEATATLYQDLGNSTGIGICTTASTYIGMAGGDTGDIVFFVNGNLWASSSLGISIGACPTGTVVGMAADLDNRKMWFRKGAIGDWNGNASNNPVTNVGGITIPAGTLAPMARFGGAACTAGNIITANFGATAFVGVVPAGFTAGWPA